MMKIIIVVLAIILTVILVIGLHEFGHFIAARWFGVKVIRVSMGLGKPVFKYVNRRDIEYVISPIPLGGYVKLLDEREGPVEKSELHLAFNRQAVWKRFIIIGMGPIFNFILAFIAFYFAFFIGIVRPLPIVAEVIPETLAAQAGIKPSQIIIKVDNQLVEDAWHSALYVTSRLGDQGNLKLTMRNSDNQVSDYQIPLKRWHINPLKPDPLESLGIKFKNPPYIFSQLYHSNYTLINAWHPAVSEINLILWFQGKMLGKLLSGKISLKSFAGPLTMFRGAAIAFSQGFVAYIQFIALISISVFIINVLPIPGLDGGQLCYLIVEKIMGKPVSIAVQVLAFRLSFILFCVLLFQLLLYDVLRMVS